MRPEEFEALARVEAQHWFYSGKRELIRRWLLRLNALDPEALLVDVGAGTGLFAQEMRSYCRVVAVDMDSVALDMIKARSGVEVLEGSAGSIPLGSASASIVTALDVLEHVDDDVAALLEFVRVVKPGGFILLTVPALPSLWSSWDEALHHRRRYTRTSLNAVVGRAPVQVLRLSYINTLGLLPIALYRIAQRSGLLKRMSRLEDRVPPAPLNRLLRAGFVEPALLPVPAPIGLSLLAILRRNDTD